LAVFFLSSQPGALNGLLDTYINKPSEGRYEYTCLAAGGETFTVMIMAEMTVGARNTDGKDYGSERYSELSFWIPCYDRAGWKRERKLKFAFFFPLLCPDSFSAIATGREMFGFRKQLASFRYPRGHLDVHDPCFTATTTAWKDIGPGNAAAPYPFIGL